MEEITRLFSIDWKSFILAFFALIIAFQFAVKLLNWLLFEFLGIETKSMREKKEDRELLIQTANGLKELTKKHSEDNNNSIKYNKKIQYNLDECMKEIHSSIECIQSAITEYSENRIHDRAQSLEIQKDLLSRDALRDEQISNLITSSRESLADRINQKYKHYLNLNGIPEDEVDEFCNLHSAYKAVGGNHSGDAKFNYCMEHLPIIPVEVKLKFDE